MSTLTPLHIGAAEDELLRNVDTLQDWISGECMGKPEQLWSPQFRALDPTVWSVPGLLAFAFDRGQKHSTRIAALNELADRYLAEHNAAVIEAASRIADEQQAERRELAA